MTQKTTITFNGTPELKACLQQWAREDDRSVSYILRDILKKERDRREAAQPEGQRQPTKK